MILYHGSNTEIMEIDLSKCRPYKDFGTGFYLTAFKEQAVRMAKNRAALYGGNPVITVFEVDDNIMEMPELNTRSFSLSPTVEWARFIVNNRSKEFNDYESPDCNIDCKYDIVFGPVADDAVAATIRRFLGEKLDEEGLRKRLTYKELSNQYSFHTERAVSHLRKVGVLSE